MIAKRIVSKSFVVALLVAAAGLLTSTASLSQTIINKGFCNIIIQGNNNSGTYFNFCHQVEISSDTPFDPPQLWLGMDIATVSAVLGARRYYVNTKNGQTTIVASGTLFGLPGTARYGFNSSRKLSWMSVEDQCSELQHDYTLRTRPPGLHPSWEQWRDSPDIRLTYDKTTSCANILNVLETLPKLFGQPESDLKGSELRTPNARQICDGITQSPVQPCNNTGAIRLTFVQDFIGTDRVTGIGMELRKLEMHGDVQIGSYLPTIRRREYGGIVSVWGPDGRPSISGDFKGLYSPYLGPGYVD